MKEWIAPLLGLSAVVSLAQAAEPLSNDTELARVEVARSLAEMGAAANAHDVERHMAFYARDPSVTLIVNGESISGWHAIRDRQREWWKNGKADIAYEIKGQPQFLVLAPDVILTTLLMTRRARVNEGPTESDLAVSSIWKKLADGWRVVYSHESMSNIPAR